MFERLSDDDISVAIDDLIGSLGVSNEKSYLDLVALLEKKDTQGCVQEIAARLRLPIRISLSYVPNNFRPGATRGFESTSMSRTDWSGHGVDGITALVCIPNSLPLFGSSALVGYPINVRVSENCSERSETFVAIMAHELSHVLLRSLCHPHRDSELHTDLVPILLGFRECVRVGRKNIRYTTEAGRTNIHTTTYGYLTDKQFEFACRKVNDTLQQHERDKKHLCGLARTTKRKLRMAKKTLALFRDCLQYLDSHLRTKMTARDAQTIVRFHTWGYTNDWESRILQAQGAVASTNTFLKTLIGYSSGGNREIKQRTLSLDQTSDQLDKLRQQIATDVKVLKRNVGLTFRLRIAIRR